ncbi:MAG: hypothetical protein HYR48_03885 [Gemmatimonadetes bacterium]|nr:hypothetical protein [Gemmatimonadota bacterium]
MTGIPAWVGPTIAISLAIIAASFLVMGGVALVAGLGLRKHSRAARDQLAKFAADGKAVTARLKGELDGFADLSTEARAKLRGAIDTVDGRLRDLDALVEVLQQEAEETALDVAAFVRTVRRSGAVIGAVKRALRSRRGARG